MVLYTSLPDFLKMEEQMFMMMFLIIQGMVFTWLYLILLIAHMNKCLLSNHLNDNEDLKDSARDWIHSQEGKFNWKEFRN